MYGFLDESDCGTVDDDDASCDPHEQRHIQHRPLVSPVASSLSHGHLSLLSPPVHLVSHDLIADPFHPAMTSLPYPANDDHIPIDIYIDDTLHTA